jgi:hypothetical protein
LVFLIRVLSFGEQDAEPTVADEAALGVWSLAEGDTIVGADPHGVAGGEVAGFGAGLDEGGEGLEVLAVVVEGSVVGAGRGGGRCGNLRGSQENAGRECEGRGGSEQREQG